MGEIMEFAGVVGVILFSALGWRWGNLWINRLRGESSEAVEAIEALEERVEALERSIADRGVPPQLGPGEEPRSSAP